jgi:hypothetical protein
VARPLAPLLCLAAALALAGCGAVSASSAPQAVPSASLACTTNACIADLAQKSLIGIIAKDEAVITKAACKPPTVKSNAGGTFTVTCTVTESDGAVYRGYANLIPSSGTITFDPQSVISSP